jgi:hypothetical protein
MEEKGICAFADKQQNNIRTADFSDLWISLIFFVIMLNIT